MKLFGITAAVFAVVAPALSYSNTYLLIYDSFYDDGDGSLADVTCAHGEHGLLTNGYTTFDSLPSYPYIGAAPQISDEQSKYCGSCWEITYVDSHGTSKCVNFTAIDAGGDKDTFRMSLKGMKTLTDGSTGPGKVQSVPITVTRKSPKACHLNY